MGTTATPWQERIRRHFIEGPPDECWPWLGSLASGGRGRFRLGGKGSRYVSAYRAVYELLRGPIPAGLVLDHLCDNPACVNPTHLRPSTQGENLRRSTRTFQGINSRKTECSNGHPFDEANTHYRPNGGRTCRTCGRAKWRRWRDRKAEPKCGS